MEMQKLSVKEQIVKTVVKSGNGGAVWVPKSWLGQEVVVMLPEKPKLELKERIVHMLEPYLKDIASAGIYGSYARNEQTEGSDADILVITSGKDIKLGFKEEKIEVTSLPVEKLKKAIERHPAVYFQMVRESLPLINASLLENLKKIKPSKKSFKPYLKETKEHIKSNKELIELDAIDNLYLKSYSALYSSMLRLRGLFIIRCILRNEEFSNKKFRKFLADRGLSSREIEDSYKAYRAVREDKDAKSLRIKLDTARKIIAILEKELELVEAQIHGK